jgi:hypothetical protein
MNPFIWFLIVSAAVAVVAALSAMGANRELPPLRK